MMMSLPSKLKEGFNMKNHFPLDNKKFSRSHFNRKGDLAYQNKLDKNWFNDNNRFSNSSKLEDSWFKINDFSMLNALLKSGFDINTRDKYGYTALFDADIKKSKYLISKGIDINATSKSDLNALFTAKSDEKMHLLIDAGIDIHKKGKRGANILFQMAIDKNEKMFIYFLEKGVSPEFSFVKSIRENSHMNFYSFLETKHEYFYKLMLVFKEQAEIKKSINSVMPDNIKSNSKKRI